MSHILIVDDDEDIRFAMGEVIRSAGYYVVSASNGKRAMQAMEQENFDLIMLDIFMPEKDGFEIIGDLRRLCVDIKILAMSGYSDHRFHPLDYAQSLGADAALAKPFSAEEALHAIRHLIGLED